MLAVTAALGALQATTQAGQAEQRVRNESLAAEICDLGWGPEVMVSVGDLRNDQRYQIPERFKRRAVGSPDSGGRRRTDSSDRRPRAGACPTRSVPIVRFRDEVAAGFRHFSGVRQEQRLAVRTRTQWRAAWRSIARSSSLEHGPPTIDFRREMVLIAAMGARPSGGYRVVIEKILDRPGDLQVVVRHISPGPNCGAIAAITHPLDAVRIPASPKPLSWVVREQVSDCS